MYKVVDLTDFKTEFKKHLSLVVKQEAKQKALIKLAIEQEKKLNSQMDFSAPLGFFDNLSLTYVNFSEKGIAVLYDYLTKLDDKERLHTFLDVNKIHRQYTEIPIFNIPDIFFVPWLGLDDLKKITIVIPVDKENIIYKHFKFEGIEELKLLIKQGEVKR